jgi:hypothetical protein
VGAMDQPLGQDETFRRIKLTSGLECLECLFLSGEDCSAFGPARLLPACARALAPVRRLLLAAHSCGACLPKHFRRSAPLRRARMGVYQLCRRRSLRGSHAGKMVGYG